MTSIAFALRTLRKAPAFTIVALVTLALGIGVNTSMYTLMDVLLFRSAPFPEPDRLLAIHGTTAQSPRDGFSFAEIEEMRALGLSEPGKPAERLQAIDASADLFPTFKVQPLAGRPFTADEGVPGRNQVALLSYELWQSRFGGDPAVIGRTLRLNAEPVTVIGAMPASFGYPMLFGKIDLWRPLTVPRHIVDDRNNHFFQAIGRLEAGAVASELQARLEPLGARWAQDYPKDSAGRGFAVMELHKSVMDSAGYLIVWMLMGLAGSVLLIACANLANLQLARTTASAKDLAIR